MILLIAMQQRQGVEGVASVAGGPGTMSPMDADDSEEWADEELTQDEDGELAEDEDGEAAYPGQSFAEEDDYEG